MANRSKKMGRWPSKAAYYRALSMKLIDSPQGMTLSELGGALNDATGQSVRLDYLRLSLEKDDSGFKVYKTGAK